MRRVKTKPLDFQTINYSDIKLNPSKVMKTYFSGFSNRYRSIFGGLPSLGDD